MQYGGCLVDGGVLTVTCDYCINWSCEAQCVPFAGSYCDTQGVCPTWTHVPGLVCCARANINPAFSRMDCAYPGPYCPSGC